MSDRPGVLVGLFAAILGLTVMMLANRLANADWSGLWAEPSGSGRPADVVAFSSGGDIFIRDLHDGTTERLIGGPDMDAKPKFAPDGHRIAWVRQRNNSHWSLMVANVDGSDARAVLDGVSELWHFDWAPDSTQLVASRGNRGGSFVVRADREGEPQRMAQGYAEARWLAGSAGFIVSDDSDWHGRLVFLSADETAVRELVAETRYLYAGPVWAVAPDGRHLAYTTDEGLELMELPDGRRRVVPHGGPGWGQMQFSADGATLAAPHTGEFRPPEMVVWRVDDFGGQPVARIRIPPEAGGMAWSLAPDGERILAVSGDTSKAWLATMESGEFAQIPWPDGTDSTAPSWRP